MAKRKIKKPIGTRSAPAGTAAKRVKRSERMAQGSKDAKAAKAKKATDAAAAKKQAKTALAKFIKKENRAARVVTPTARKRLLKELEASAMRRVR